MFWCRSFFFQAEDGIRDTEVVIRRTLDTVTILKRLEEIKDMRLRREALASGRGGGMDDRKMYEK